MSNVEDQITEDWAEVARLRFSGIDVNSLTDETTKWCVINAGIPQPGNKLKLRLVFDGDVGMWLRFRSYEESIRFALQRYMDWKTRRYEREKEVSLEVALLDEPENLRKLHPNPNAPPEGTVKHQTAEEMQAELADTNPTLYEELIQAMDDLHNDVAEAPKVEATRNDYRLRISGPNAQVVLDLDFDLVDWYQRKFKLDYTEVINRVLRTYMRVMTMENGQERRSH